MDCVSVAISNQIQILLIVGIKSLLSKQKVTLTTSIFTLILPYPATQFVTTYNIPLFLIVRGIK